MENETLIVCDVDETCGGEKAEKELARENSVKNIIEKVGGRNYLKFEANEEVVGLIADYVSSELARQKEEIIEKIIGLKGNFPVANNNYGKGWQDREDCLDAAIQELLESLKGN